MMMTDLVMIASLMSAADTIVPPEQIASRKAIFNVARLAALMQNEDVDATVNGTVKLGAIMTVLSTARDTDTAMAETFRVVDKNELRNTTFSEFVAPIAEVKSDTVGEDVKMMTVRRNVGGAVQRYIVSGAGFGVSVDQAARASSIVNGRYSAIFAQYNDLLDPYPLS